MISSLLSPTTTARRRILLGSALGLLALAAPILELMAAATAPTPPAVPTAPAPAAEVLFMRDIAPILAQRCFSCHDAKAKEPGGELRLDTYEGMTKGDHPAVLPGEPEYSGIILRATEEDGSSRMPRDADPLPRAQIDLIRRWIKAGAKFDGPDPKTAYAQKPAAADTPTATPHPIHPPVAPAATKPDTQPKAGTPDAPTATSGPLQPPAAPAETKTEQPPKAGASAAKNEKKP
jgi:mono/diheme cytochrome c family protein